MRPGPRFIILMIFSLSWGISGCAVYEEKPGTKSFVKECVLPPDQSGTLSGKWKTTAVPVALHEGEFAPEEAAEIATAASTWNEFFAASLNLTALDIGSKENPRTIGGPHPTKANLCDSSIVSGSQFSGQVVIFKNPNWPSNYPKTAIAITSFCTAAVQPIPTFFNAMIEINYQFFFVEGQKIPDLQTIVLHELGHIMGLNHSCESNPVTGVPDCNSATLSPDYSAAVMYPVFGFDGAGIGQQKRELTANDQGRTNCLYQ